VTRSEPVVAAVGSALEILVAEDSPIIATLVSSLLTKQGFRPTVVADGIKALAAVSEKLYDLVLMDVQMPEMDGISATKAIRALPGAVRDVPIIALTANALVGQRETYLAAGMNDYITKPIQPPLLFAAINRWALRQAEAPPLQPGPGGRRARYRRSMHSVAAVRRSSQGDRFSKMRADSELSSCTSVLERPRSASLKMCFTFSRVRSSNLRPAGAIITSVDRASVLDVRTVIRPSPTIREMVLAMVEIWTTLSSAISETVTTSRSASSVSTRQRAMSIPDGLSTAFIRA
jgi:CheY-like chemotaxis protein